MKDEITYGHSDSKIFDESLISELDQQPQDGGLSKSDFSEEFRLLKQENKDLVDRLTKVELDN
jgi:hypothetical protein